MDLGLPFPEEAQDLTDYKLLYLVQSLKMDLELP